MNGFRVHLLFLLLPTAHLPSPFLHFTTELGSKPTASMCNGFLGFKALGVGSFWEVSEPQGVKKQV